MSILLLFLIVLALASPSMAEDTPPFKIKTKRDNDRVEVKFEKGTAILVIRSPFGISSAIVGRAEADWPDAVVLRMHLSGLESFKASNGNTTMEAAVSSQNGKARVWVQSKENTPLNADHPYWMPIRMIGSDDKETKVIPLREGYFEIKLPKKLFENNPKSITLNWIDFYRN